MHALPRTQFEGWPELHIARRNKFTPSMANTGTKIPHVALSPGCAFCAGHLAIGLLGVVTRVSSLFNVYFTRVYRVGVWLGFVRFAALLAVVLCCVDRCFGSWVLLGLFCLDRATQTSERETPRRGRTNQQTHGRNPIQPISHNCTPTRTASLHNQHSLRGVDAEALFV